MNWTAHSSTTAFCCFHNNKSLTQRKRSRNKLLDFIYLFMSVIEYFICIKDHARQFEISHSQVIDGWFESSHFWLTGGWFHRWCSFAVYFFFSRHVKGSEWNNALNLSGTNMCKSVLNAAPVDLQAPKQAQITVRDTFETVFGYESDNMSWPWVRQHELAMSQTTRADHESDNTSGHESDNTRWPWVGQHEVAMSQITRVDGSWPLAGQATGRYLQYPRFHLWLQQREGSVGHYVCMPQVISASNYIINAYFL